MDKLNVKPRCSNPIWGANITFQVSQGSWINFYHANISTNQIVSSSRTWPGELLHQWHFYSLAWTCDVYLLKHTEQVSGWKKFFDKATKNILPSFFSINVVKPSEVTLSVTTVVPGCYFNKNINKYYGLSNQRDRIKHVLWLLSSYFLQNYCRH